ncbi:hypothetical protein [Actinomadura sp. 6N118]|uniref:hypothetical protein n=1 Tax=Actinomadura sp. 6N118 TaxID=3375151 RepID=UPI0037B3CC78
MEPPAADDHAAGRAADAIPVVLDPFVLRLVPTARAVRTVRRLGHDPAAHLRTIAPSQSPGTAESTSPKQDASAAQVADAAECASARQSRSDAQPAPAAQSPAAAESASAAQPPAAAESEAAVQPPSAAQSASAGKSPDTAGAAEGGQSARDNDDEPGDDEPAPISPEQVRDHLRRRAIFLRELAEARELRERVTPHRARRARIHAALRRRTFRLN